MDSQPPNQSDREHYWSQRARAVVRRINAAWWLDRFLPVLFLVTLLFSAGILLARRHKIEPVSLPILYLALLLLAGILCFLLARRKFMVLKDGLVRLEAQSRLHNRLTAATKGAGGWPAEDDSVGDRLCWRWPLIAPPVLASLVLIVAALFIPVEVVEGSKTKEFEKPISWQQLESLIEALEKAEVVEEEATEELKSRLEELKQQPAQTWYEHSSLEAGDTLRMKTENELRFLAEDMENLSTALSEAAQLGDQMSEAARQKLSQQFETSLEHLQAGNLPLSKELREKLSQVDPKTLRPTTQQELEQLLKKLRNSTDKLQQALGQKGKQKASSKLGDQGKENQASQQDTEGREAGRRSGNERGQKSGGSQGPESLAGKAGQDGKECGAGEGEKEDSDGFSAAGRPQTGSRPGQGGITRGPGEAPLEYGEDGHSFEIGREEVISDGSSERDETEYDLLAVTRGEHEVDRTKPHELVAAGRAGSVKRGGLAVWKETPIPQEQEVLQKYFQ